MDLDKIRRKFRDNVKKSKGRFGEIAFVQQMGSKGKMVKPTGVGSDYGDENGNLYEIKTDKSGLTKRQKATKKKLGKKYKVIRYGFGLDI